MAQLLDLPVDTLLQIVTLVKDADFVSPFQSVKKLSLICKSLNEACAHIIFRTYRLVVRHSDWSVRERLGEVNTWDQDAVMARIAHLRSKAAFVRELRLIDQGDSNAGPDSPPAFPDLIMPQLLDILNAIPGLTDLTLEADGRATVPIDIWNACVKKDILGLTILSFDDIPEGLQPMPHVQRLTVLYSSNTSKILDLVNPQEINLNYRYRGPLMPYKPRNANLKKVNISTALSRNIPAPIWNFSGVPQASISIEIPIDCEYKFHILPTWQKIKKNIHNAFEEGVTGYEVRRYGNSGPIKIYRPSAEEAVNWKPRYFAHLEGAEEEEEERVAMANYYKMRTREQFGSYI